MRIDYPAYKIERSDLKRLEVVAQRVLGPVMTLSAALELTARSAGFSSAEGMLAALDEGPVLLISNGSREREFCEQRGYDLHQIVEDEKCPVVALIAAGMAWAEQDDIGAAMQRPAHEKLAFTRKDGGTLPKYRSLLRRSGTSQYSAGATVYRSSLLPADLELPQKLWSDRIQLDQDVLVVLRPDDMKSFMFSNHTRLRYLSRPAVWMAQKARVRDTGYMVIESQETWPIDWSSREEVMKTFGGVDVACFDPAGEAAIADMLELAGAPGAHASIHALKDTVLFINDEVDGDLFTSGYKGAANLDLPDRVEDMSSQDLSRFGIGWLAELVTMVWQFEAEATRLSGSPQGAGGQDTFVYVPRPSVSQKA